MHWLVIGIALVLASIWLFVMNLQLASDVLRAMQEQIRSHPTERTSGALDTPIDRGE
jgi:hypothetical protein